MNKQEIKSAVAAANTKGVLVIDQYQNSYGETRDYQLEPLPPGGYRVLLEIGLEELQSADTSGLDQEWQKAYDQAMDGLRSRIDNPRSSRFGSFIRREEDDPNGFAVSAKDPDVVYLLGMLDESRAPEHLSLVADPEANTEARRRTAIERQTSLACYIPTLKLEDGKFGRVYHEPRHPSILLLHIKNQLTAPERAE